MKVDQVKVIEELIELRYKAGYAHTSLVKYLKETYDINTTRAYELINIMKTQIGDMYNKINDNVLEDAIETLEKMKQDAVGSGDKKLALEIQKELNKIKQLHIQKMTVDMNVKIEQPLFPPDEIKEEDKGEEDKK